MVVFRLGSRRASADNALASTRFKRDLTQRSHFSTAQAKLLSALRAYPKGTKRFTPQIPARASDLAPNDQTRPAWFQDQGRAKPTKDER
jgi:hypothetical protein